MTVCGLETLKHFLNILPHKNIMVRGENFHALSVIFANQVFIAVHMCVHFHICLFTSTSIFALFKQCFTLKTFHLLHILQYTQFQQTFIFPLPICSPLDALRLLAVRAKLSMLSMREYLVFTSGLEQEKKFSDSLIVLERFDSWRPSSLLVSTLDFRTQ